MKKNFGAWSERAGVKSVLHYRELECEFRHPTGLSEANLAHIPAIIDRIISHGGQVV